MKGKTTRTRLPCQLWSHSNLLLGIENNDLQIQEKLVACAKIRKRNSQAKKKCMEKHLGYNRRETIFRKILLIKPTTPEKFKNWTIEKQYEDGMVCMCSCVCILVCVCVLVLSWETIYIFIRFKLFSFIS